MHAAGHGKAGTWFGPFVMASVNTRVVRRAERETVTLARHDAVRPEAVRYLNRLSDLLFVLARVLARASGHGEVLWNHERR